MISGIASRADAAIDPELLDIRRYVYVPSATTPEISVIDIDADSIVATLPTATVAREAVISREAAMVIVADGFSPSVTLVDVFNATARKVDLPLVAQRLTVSVNGQILAAHDISGNAIALVDLGEGRMMTRISGLPPVRDVMFGRNDTVLYVAADGVSGVGVIDIATGRLLNPGATSDAMPKDVSALARTADGRKILALSRGGRFIDVLDGVSDERVGRLDVGPGTAGMFPSGVGKYLLVPDNVTEKLTVFRAAHLDKPIALDGAGGVTGIYATWLDTIAFMPSAARKSVLVYDLDGIRPLDMIALRGAPARGAVTPDTRTLYLPVINPPQLLAVDGMTRQVARIFDLPSPPLAALIAGGSGICH